MIPGRITLRGAEASIDEDGWHCDDPQTLALLNTLAPLPATAAGAPWVQAFWTAVRQLGAISVQIPEPDEEPPGRIH